MSYYAITTRWAPPTHTRGSRITATTAGRTMDAPVERLTIHWDHALNIERNHGAAARALAEKRGNDGVWIAGTMPKEDGNVYVRLDGSFSREWCEKYLCGIEGADWFHLPPKQP